MKHSGSLALLFSLGLGACRAAHPSLSSLSPAQHLTVRATVASVHDGDTLTVFVNETREKIRLHGIDCPETDQPWGQEATELTRQLADKKEVTVIEFGHDKYHRMIGQIVLADGRHLNQELVREGACWWYEKYAPDDTLLKQLEEEAKQAKRGVWSDSQPTPPWAWRHQKK